MFTRSNSTETSDAKTIAQQFAQRIQREARFERVRFYAPMILLGVMTLIFSITTSHFFSAKNLSYLMGQAAAPLILATGLTFVLLIGSIDLSIEGVMGFVGSLISILVLNSRNDNDFGVMGVFIALAAGVLFGIITGVLHVKLRIASFIITFAMGSLVTGLGVFLYMGQPATIKVAWADFVAGTMVLGLPLIMWVALIHLAVCTVLLNYTAFGRAVYAIGDNEAAARASGIDVDLVKIKVFALSGFSAALAGFVAVMRLKLGQVDIGTGQLFPCITALVVGGTALTGGKGGMTQTVVGIFIYMELQNFLTIQGVSPEYKNAILGAIILVAVALTITRTRKTITK